MSHIRLFNFVLYLLVTLVFFVQAGSAAPSEEEDKPKKDPPQRGLLGSSGTVGYGSLSIPESFEGEITGGVSLSREACSYTVANTSEEATYRISLELNQFGAKQKKIRSRSFGHKLKPGESEKGSDKVRSGTIGCSLWITRWRSDKKKKEEKEEKIEPQEEKAWQDPNKWQDQWNEKWPSQWPDGKSGTQRRNPSSNPQNGTKPTPRGKGNPLRGG